MRATLVQQVPSLEYKNEVKGESLDLIKYIDETFEGPALLPDVSDFLMLSLGGCHVCLHLILEAIGSCKEAVCRGAVFLL